MADIDVAAKSTTTEREVLLNVKGLKKYFPIEKGFLRRVVGHVKAADDVSFQIRAGETLGLVGESGCGKTSVGRCVVRAIDPTAGEIRLRLQDGSVVDVAKLQGNQLRRVRRHMQMIFQDPYSSLDPRMTILETIGEPLKYNKIADGEKLVARVKELMDVVGLSVQHLNRYPHAFSGGQRQRIGIARAIAPNPRLVVCDEALSALDISVRAQIINLLHDLQQEFHLTYLFIAHDLAVIQRVSHHVAVMYLGEIVEMAETNELFTSPKHPYTEALLSAVPKVDPEDRRERIVLPGDVPNPADAPTGCPFHPRCNYAREICSKEKPIWEEVTPGHFASCHFARELNLRGA